MISNTYAVGGFIGGIASFLSEIVRGLLRSLGDLTSDVIALDPVLLQLLVFALLLGSVFGLTALGLTLIFGVMDVINFAHGMLLVLGMYFVWWTSNTVGINPLVLIPAAFVALFLFGVVMSVTTIEPIMEEPIQNQFIVTLGWTFVLLAGVQIVFESRPRSLRLSYGNLNFFGASVPITQLLALVLTLLTVVLFWVFLFRTELGMAIRATADNRDGARTLGINVPNIDHVTFGIGCGLAALAGAAIALFSPFDPFLSESYLLRAFVIVILGGLGSIPGALIGGMIIGFLEVFGSFYLPGTTHEFMIFSLFFLVLLVKPTGLLGDKEVEV
jgi:branched-chain amino acid transport system permease protein